MMPILIIANPSSLKMSHGASLLSQRDCNESFFDAAIQKAKKCCIKLMAYKSISVWHDEC
jgi:hypothetical protein